MVWTNERVIKWVQSVDLKDYANNLIESGVHGSLIALDDSIDHNSMALALQIATANTQVGCHTGHWAEGGSMVSPLGHFRRDPLNWTLSHLGLFCMRA